MLLKSLNSCSWHSYSLIEFEFLMGTYYILPCLILMRLCVTGRVAPTHTRSEMSSRHLGFPTISLPDSAGPLSGSWVSLFLPTLHQRCLCRLGFMSSWHKSHLRRQKLNWENGSERVVLNLPHAETLEYSSSCCSDSNHKLISLLFL